MQQYLSFDRSRWSNQEKDPIPIYNPKLSQKIINSKKANKRFKASLYVLKFPKKGLKGVCTARKSQILQML